MMIYCSKKNKLIKIRINLLFDHIAYLEYPVF